MVKELPIEVPSGMLTVFHNAVKNTFYDHEQKRPVTPPAIAMGLLFVCIDFLYTALSLTPDHIMEIMTALLERVAEVRGDELRIKMQVDMTTEIVDTAVEDKKKAN